jgi:PST family polysaccharide transporter
MTGAISMFVIARLIGADEFGRGAIALGIILIMQVGVNSLVHDALVRMPDLQQEDVDTGFTASLALAILFMVLTAVAAPHIGRLYDDSRLTLLIFGFVPLLPLAALSETLIATCRRGLDFRTVAMNQIGGRVIGSVLGILAAILHAGAWALVIQSVSMATYITAAMLIHVKIRPGFRMSWQRLSPMLGFCAPIITSQVMMQGTSRLLLLAVGHWHGLSVAGYWSAATRIAENLFGGLMQAAYNVGLAHFSIRQNARDTLLANLRVVQSVTAFLAVPVLTGLAVAAHPLILLLLGPSWETVATLMLGPLLVCFLQIRRMFPTTALRAVGRSGVSLISSSVELAVMAVAFIAFGRQSVTALNFIYPLGILAGSIPIFVLLIGELRASALVQALVFARELLIGVLGFVAGSAAMSAVGEHAAFIQLFVGGGVAFAAAAILLILTDARQLMRIAGIAQKPQAR